LTKSPFPSTNSATGTAWHDTWQRIRSATEETVVLESGRFGVDSRFLIRRALLHLPRFDGPEIFEEETIRKEVKRLAEKVRVRPSRPSVSDTEKACTRFTLVRREMAKVVHEQFHYIGAFREGLHFGLFAEDHDELPAVIATCSDLDIEHLAQYLPSGLTSANALLASRVFAFSWAPRNSISFLFGRIRQWLRLHSHPAQLLFSYVNPNLGFDGASYRASGWRLVGQKQIGYRYWNGDYITARECWRMMGASSENGDPCCCSLLTMSNYSLEPLQIWALDTAHGRGGRSKVSNGRDHLSL